VVEIVFEPVTEEQVSELSALAKQTFYDAFVGTCTPADMQAFLHLYYDEEPLLVQLRNPNITYYFAKHMGKPIAYMSLGMEQPNFTETGAAKALELKRLYVANAYHGKKVAQQLMDIFFEHATQQQAPFAFLGVWEYNYKAQNFYKKYGFQKTKNCHAFPIGETEQTDIYLVKRL
jgi:diamine N-acetyltransferase